MPSIMVAEMPAQGNQPCAGCQRPYPEEELDDRALCMKCDFAQEDARFAADVTQRQHEEADRFRQVAKGDIAATLEEAKLWFTAQREELDATAKVAAEWLEDVEAAGGKPAEIIGEPLSTFEAALDGSFEAGLPTAMLQRSDGATLAYDGKLNFLFGTPGTGKSWVALFAVQEALLRGQRAIYWDFEDSPSTLQERAKALGLDVVYYWREGQFKYLRPGAEDSALAMAEATAWAEGGEGPTLVVIDSAESSGCPSSGDSVNEWLDKIVFPFRNVGAGLLVIDHVAKRKEGRPLGPIGSQHKLARIDGAALFVTGIPWTLREGGYLTIHNHKDRLGALPAPISKPVGRISGVHEGQHLVLRLTPPQEADNPEELYTPTLKALAEHGEWGVWGHEAATALVTGRAQRRKSILAELIAEGYVGKVKDKGARMLRYHITPAGRAFIAGFEDEE